MKDRLTLLAAFAFVLVPLAFMLMITPVRAQWTGGAFTSVGGGGAGGITAPFVLVSDAAGHVPFTIKGKSGQTADLQDWRDSGNILLVSLDNVGDIITTASITCAGFAHTGNANFNGSKVFIQPDSAGHQPLLVRGASGQSVDLTDWRDSNNTQLTGIGPLGDLIFSSTNGLQFLTGANQRVGSGTLSGGTVTIANTSITSKSHIFLQDTNSTVTNLGELTVSSKTAATGFVVKSSNSSDGSTFDYRIEEWN